MFSALFAKNLSKKSEIDIYSYFFPRELYNGKNSYCKDIGELSWLAIPRETKRKLERRGIYVAKTSNASIVLFKAEDDVNERIISSFSHRNCNGDRYLISPTLTDADIKKVDRVLKTSFAQKSSFLKRFVRNASINKRDCQVAGVRISG